jgi:glutathione S-transferase
MGFNVMMMLYNRHMPKRKHILYSFRRCPYAMRARMGMVLGKIDFEIIEVDLKNKPDHMIEISPKATVPVLWTSDNKVIDESLEIVTWACGDDFDHDLIAENDGQFKRALDRYKYPNRYEGEDCSGARGQGENFLKKLNEIVSIQEASLNDICIFPFVRQFTNVDCDWFDALPYRNVHEWLDYHLNSDLFKTIIDKNFKRNQE